MRWLRDGLGALLALCLVLRVGAWLVALLGAEVTRQNPRALHATQRIHRVGWRAREAMADQAQQRRPGQQ